MRENKQLNLLTYFPGHIHRYGVGYAFHSLTLNMQFKGLHSKIFSIKSEFHGTSSFDIELISNLLIYKLVLKFMDQRKVQRWANKKFIELMKNYEYAFLAPGVDYEVFVELKSLGKKIIIENINTHQNFGKEILEYEANRIGLQTDEVHQITEQNIDNENKKLQLIDLVFSPSELVTRSLTNAGVDPAKIINSSYGLSPKQQIYTARKQVNKGEKKFTVLFAGRGIIRKGLHLLLEYWDAAQIDGVLRVVGRIDDSLDSLIKPYLARGNIEFVAFTENLEDEFLNADVFAIPSLEEGSPLVTYLALGAGLPVLASPMGAGGIIRDQIDGFVIEPHDREKWIMHFKMLARDIELRHQLSENAAERSNTYLWSEVGRQRAESILSAFSQI